MSRDYKSARTSRKKKTKKKPVTPGWVWLTSGLIGGVLLSLGMYYFLSGKISGGMPDRTTPPAADIKKTTEPAPEQADNDEVKKPRFDFYTLLPKLEVVIPDTDIEATPKALSKPDNKVAYILQAGSFRSFSDADALKARLALIGIEAGIQSVVINDADTWYRVRIGPYQDKASIKALRRQLRQNHVDYMVLEIKI